MGKCESCGKPTKTAKDGTDYRKCWDCSQKAKAEPAARLPADAKERIADLGTTFQMSLGQAFAAWDDLEERLMQENGEKTKPAAPIEFKVRTIWEAAMHLNNQYWKNDRTPR